MRITLLSEIDPDARAALEEGHEVVVAYRAAAAAVPASLTGSEVVVLRSGAELTRSVLEEAHDLRLVIRAGSGLDNIDLQAAQDLGIRVVRIPGPSSRAVAELTLGLMVAVGRNLLTADASMRRGEWRKHELAGHLLLGKTVGVVGLGNVGSAVATLCRAVGMEVTGCVLAPTEMAVKRLAAAGIGLQPLPDLAATADFLTFHVPLDASTHHMVDDDLLAVVKPGSYLINTSRGGVVDERALLRALESGGRLAGAALDVHEVEGGGRSPLADRPDVVLTPHIGSMALETQSEIGRRLVEIVDGYVDGRLDTLLEPHERVA